MRQFLHVDMDAFFAAVEQRDRPELRGLPVIVGSRPDQRGVVSTCSYEARVFGVHSAMPSREAYQRCPQGIFLTPDMSRYAAVSRQVFAIFDRFTPRVEPLGIDEAFLDVTGVQRLFGDGVAIAERIRAAIHDELHLTASVGVASNKFLAKLGSEIHKPDGLTVVPTDPAAIIAWLAPLPVGRLWGVGKVLRAQLEQSGYRTVGDLQRVAEPMLVSIVGRATAGHLIRLAHGEDPREVELDRTEKSISRENTFLKDVRDVALLRRTLHDLADDVGGRLRADGRFAGTVRLKLRWSDFRTITRQRRLDPPCIDDISLREAADRLFNAETLVQPVRLIGFGVTDLIAHRSAQPDLFDPQPVRLERRERLSAAVDRIRAKLGEGSIRRAEATDAGPSDG